MAHIINIPIKVKRWKNKGGIWIVYSKKFDISGYGETKKKAMDMFKFVVKDILTPLYERTTKRHSKK